MADETLISILARLARAAPRNADVLKAYELACRPAIKEVLRDPRNGTSYWALQKRKQRARKKHNAA